MKLPETRLTTEPERLYLVLEHALLLLKEYCSEEPPTKLRFFRVNLNAIAALEDWLNQFHKAYTSEQMQELDRDRLRQEQEHQKIKALGLDKEFKYAFSLTMQLKGLINPALVACAIGITS